MERIGLDFLVGTFTGQTEYLGKGRNFPLIYVHFVRSIDNVTVRLLADRERWFDQGGDELKVGKDKIKISYGIYSTMQKGQEIIMHIFEDLYGDE